MLTADTHVADWLRLIRAVISRFQGLRLTKRQIQRLWGLDHITAEAVLASLVDVKFLRCTRHHACVRADVG